MLFLHPIPSARSHRLSEQIYHPSAYHWTYAQHVVAQFAWYEAAPTTAYACIRVLIPKTTTADPSPPQQHLPSVPWPPIPEPLLRRRASALMANSGSKQSLENPECASIPNGLHRVARLAPPLAVEGSNSKVPRLPYLPIDRALARIDDGIAHT